MLSRLLCAIVLALTVAGSTGATIITGTLTDLGGDRWQADYTIGNNSLAVAIEEVTLWFELGFYENLSVAATPFDWDAIAINPDPSIPDDGFYDALALGSGIAAGDSLSGFSLVFDWLGTGNPANQFFDIVDPLSFAVLDSGQTDLEINSPPPPTSVPEPSTLFLIILALLLLFASVKITRSRHSGSHLICSTPCNIVW